MSFLEKLWKIWEIIGILNLLQQKEEETFGKFGVITKLSYYKVFHRKFTTDIETKFDAWITN